MGDQKNLLLAVALSIVILIGWNVLIEQPKIEKQRAAQERQQEMLAKKSGQATSPAGAQQAPATGGPQLGAAPVAAPATPGITRTEALKRAPRVQIDTPRIQGSISLAGARLDDVILKEYRVSLDANSERIQLLQPTHSEKPYYAEFGWLGFVKDVKLPNRETVWTSDGGTLSPSHPVTLRWDNGEGLVFEQVYKIDDQYMITVTQRVRNTGSQTVSLAPYGLIARNGLPHTLGYYILHEGPLGVFDGTLKEVNYDDLVNKDGGVEQPIRGETTGGWLGFTDKYWLVALVPDKSAHVRTSFKADKRGDMPVFQTDYLGDTLTVAPGTSIERTDSVFAGAKVVRLLDKYESDRGITGFDKAVDWGWFYFLTKPIFFMMDWFYAHLGNFGLAILALTITIKAAFFPLANKSYRSMSKMKTLQPKMVELKERFGDDKQRLNQAMMELYKKEQVNPASGCLPMLVQIPVFFSLYKVLFVTIEMRHAPFYGWIHDLSAPDPLTLLTGFGLFAWKVPEILHFVNIGLWPVIMGLTMFLQQRLNPTPADPVQAKIFAFMPLIFTFILAPFPAGLVIYWAWNNLLSISQQWVIMKRMSKATATTT